MCQKLGHASYIHESHQPDNFMKYVVGIILIPHFTEGETETQVTGLTLGQTANSCRL